LYQNTSFWHNTSLVALELHHLGILGLFSIFAWISSSNFSGINNGTKTKLVVKGYLQKNDVDYTEVFSPVIKLTTIWMFLDIIATENLHMEQLDVKTTFLHITTWGVGNSEKANWRKACIVWNKYRDSGTRNLINSCVTMSSKEVRWVIRSEMGHYCYFLVFSLLFCFYMQMTY
jgi:Reverse transcriptase (RNA-dependent DNA polymerase)